MWDDPKLRSIQYAVGQASRRWAILTKMETAAFRLRSFVAWPSAGTQFGSASSFCYYFFVGAWKLGTPEFMGSASFAMKWP